MWFTSLGPVWLTRCRWVSLGKGDGPTEQSFDRAKLIMIFGGDEARGAAGRADAGRATDSVHIIFRTRRQVVVDDMPDVLDIYAAGGDVRGDQNPKGAALESFQCAPALR